MIFLIPFEAFAARCPALQEENSYTGKFKSMKFLIEGKDGWFFRSRQDLREDFSLKDQNWEKLREVQKAFRKKDIELLIAFPPTRGMAAPQMVPSSSAYHHERALKSYKAFLQKAQEEKVLIAGTPDIKSADLYFYKADHHWTTAGAQEMAIAVSAMVRSLPVYKNLEKSEYSTRPVGQKSMKSILAKPIEAICGQQVADLSDTVYSTVLQSSGNSEENLFGESPVPQIVLVGTSNSKRETLDMNFEGFLKKYISADVYNASLSGSGVGDPMISFIESDIFSSGRVHVLIWEIPGYYNLGSDRFQDTLRQILAMLKGDCMADASFEARNIPVMQGSRVFNINDDHIDIGKSYLVLDFDRPLKNKSFLTLQMGDHDYETFQFRRSSRQKDSETYFYKPDYSGESLLKKISLKFPEGNGPYSYDLRVCPYE